MKIVILGAGGHGQVVADMIAAGARAGGEVLELAGFLDDDPALLGAEVDGAPVLGSLASVGRLAIDAFIVAIGRNSARARIDTSLQASGRSVVSICHPRAVISRNVAIGDGAMISAGAIVITGSRIGRGVILNTGCTVDHHSRIGDYAHVAPGAHLGGEVSVGACSLIGIGAVILPRCRIGAGCTIGAGAVVIGDVPDGATAVGVPARLLPSSSGHSVKSQLAVER